MLMMCPDMEAVVMMAPPVALFHHRPGRRLGS